MPIGVNKTDGIKVYGAMCDFNSILTDKNKLTEKTCALELCNTTISMKMFFFSTNKFKYGAIFYLYVFRKKILIRKISSLIQKLGAKVFISFSAKPNPFKFFFGNTRKLPFYMVKEL